jgi:hypothetical protein
MAVKTETAKKPQGLIVLLAALMYFDSVKPEQHKNMIPFEKLTEAEQDPFLKPAGKFLIYLDKLNLVPGPKVDLKKQNVLDSLNTEELKDKIDAFVKKLKTTKPSLFPSMELAMQLKAPKA